MYCKHMSRIKSNRPSSACFHDDFLWLYAYGIERHGGDENITVASYRMWRSPPRDKPTVNKPSTTQVHLPTNHQCASWCQFNDKEFAMNLLRGAKTCTPCVSCKIVRKVRDAQMARARLGSCIVFQVIK